MGKGLGFFLNTTEMFSLLLLQLFLVCQKTRSVEVSDQFIFDICGCWWDFLLNQKKICGSEVFRS